MGDILAFGLLWIVVSVLGELGLSGWIHNGTYYYTASTSALVGQDAFNFLLTVLFPVFSFVVVLIIYAMIRFRAHKGETGDAKDQRRYNPAFIYTWVIVSIVVNLMFFLHPTASGLQAIFDQASPAANKNALIVDVTARQWEWIFTYPQYGITEALDGNGHDVLVLPVDRPVHFILRSADPFHPNSDNQIVRVIHGFWIPAFGMKVDVIPGETRDMYVLPTKITSTAVNQMVRVQCSEVCGGGHPYMITTLQILSSSNFDAWVKWQLQMQNAGGS